MLKAYKYLSPICFREIKQRKRYFWNPPKTHKMANKAPLVLFLQLQLRVPVYSILPSIAGGLSLAIKDSIFVLCFFIGNRRHPGCIFLQIHRWAAVCQKVGAGIRLAARENSCCRPGKSMVKWYMFRSEVFAPPVAALRLPLRRDLLYGGVCAAMTEQIPIIEGKSAVRGSRASRLCD